GSRSRSGWSRRTAGRSACRARRTAASRSRSSCRGSARRERRGPPGNRGAAPPYRPRAARRPTARRAAGKKGRMPMTGRILVVDDEPAITVAIRRLLARGGHTVDTAGSLDEALDRLGRDAYHVVVTDLNLAGRSGLDVLRAARERSPATAV